MANTKDLDRAERKAAKRKARQDTKARFAALTLKQRKALRKYEGTLSAFLREQEEGGEG